MKRLLKLAPSLALLFTLSLPLAASAQITVVTHRRIGNNTEGVTYAPSGTLKDRAIAIDGNDVISIALQGTGHSTLFDLHQALPQAATPRGIAYSPATNFLYFSSKASQPQIFVTDLQGNAKPTITLADPNASDWSNFEGMTSIPANAPAFGGTLAAMGVHNSDFISHIYYLDPFTGAILGETVPQSGTPVSNYLCGISYWPAHPGTLLVSDCNTGIWQMDMSTGAFIGDPSTPLIAIGPQQDIESVIARNNGDIYTNEYESGVMAGYTAAFQRTPSLDRSFVIGLGVSAGYLAWNYDTNELLTATISDNQLYAVSPNLKSSRLLPLPAGTGEQQRIATMAYLGNGKIAYGDRQYPRGIDIVDLASGASLSRLFFACCQTDPDPFPSGRFNPAAIAANGTSTFLVRIGSDASNLKVVTRSGTPDTSVYPDGVIPARLPEIALSNPATGPTLQIFDNGSGPRIFTGAEVYDTEGNLLSLVDQSALGITDGVFSAVWIGGDKFAVEDGDTSTVTIFKMQ